MSAEAVPAPIGMGDSSETNPFEGRARAHLEQTGPTPALSEPRPVRQARPAPLLNLGNNRRGRPAPIGSSPSTDFGPVSGARHEDVLMPAMPRTLSSGLDLFRNNAPSPVPIGLSLLSNASALPTPTATPAVSSLATSVPPTPMGGSSNSVGTFLDLSRTATPLENNALASLAGTPAGEFPPSTPTLLIADQIPAIAASVNAPSLPGVPMTQSQQSQQQQLSAPAPVRASIGSLGIGQAPLELDAAALLHHFRSSARTPTPNAQGVMSNGVFKEENVYERNLMLLNNGTVYDPNEVVPKPRSRRAAAAAATRTVSNGYMDPSLPLGLKPSEFMVPDVLPPLDYLGNVIPGGMDRPARGRATTSRRKAPGGAAATAAAASKGKKATRRRASEDASDGMDEDDDDDDDDQGDDDDDEEDGEGEDDGSTPIPRKRKGQTEDDQVLARKRRRRREKCRVAATRFRQKKREEMMTMEESVTMLEQSNSDLMAEMVQLRKKIADTKTFLMQHEKCLGQTTA